MKWYKKQLTEKLKKIESDKNGLEKNIIVRPARHSFDPKKIIGKRKSFNNPVAAMNRNRKKTDLP